MIAFGSRIGSSVVVAAMAVLLGGTVSARADSVDITYSAPGQYAPDFSSICASTNVCDFGTENFSAWSGSVPYTSTFNDAGAGTYSQPSGVSFTGVYTPAAGTTFGPGAEFQSVPQNLYGGVSGQSYPELYGSPMFGLSNTASYTLSLSSTGVRGINYFGVWISALDPYNDLKIYNGTTMVAELNSASLISALGTCVWYATSPYCSNPTAQFKNGDAGELFVYVNVIDLTGFITSVQFSNGLGYTGFETDNHAVGYVNPPYTSGTLLSAFNSAVAIPEPAPMAILAIGLAGLGFARRKRSTT